MAHGSNPVIKLEIECSNVNIKSVNPQLQNSSNSLINSSVNSGTTNQTINNTGSVSAKMGSRRIFTPQFKLQVLESYRNDSDCKGNQRATARKYGIHRRQIQKWLQCENNLRSSVANLNQNNMKHQFHNISHHHQIPVVSSSATAITTTHSINNNSNNSNNNNNQQYKTNILSLDTARHSVGLTPRPVTVQVPVPVGPTATTSAIATPSTVMADSQPARLTTNNSNISATTVTPASTTQSLLKSPTHTITKIQAPSYNVNMPVVHDTMLTHTPAISSISSVSLVHHYPHHHTQHNAYNEQQQQLQQQHQQHSHYHQHHNHLQQHESRPLMPSASLSMPRSSSPVLTTAICTDELRDYQPITVTGSCYIKEDYSNQQTYENFHYRTNESGLIAPIDLSLGPRQTVYEGEIQVNVKHNVNDDEFTLETIKTTNVWPEIEKNNNECRDFSIKNEIQNSSQVDSQAIDLTCRKRKNYSDTDAPAEKVQRTCNTNDGELADASKVRKSETGTDNSQQPKPVKLFKPYLLDDESDDKKKVKSEPHDPIIWSHHPNCATASAGYDSHTITNFQSNEHGYPFPTGSPTFQRDVEHNNYTTAATAEPPSPSAFITRTTPPIAQPNPIWCPKGSPVSGYDSASTYSDSSDYIYRSQHYHHHYPSQCQTYSLDLKMQAVDSYYYDMTCRADQLAVAGKFDIHRSEVQRWLDQETDMRQGIAVYV